MKQSFGIILLILVCSSSSPETSLAQLEPANSENVRAEEQAAPILTGRVVHSKDPDYEKARLVSNYYTSKHKRPEVIVYCQGAEDVQNAVKWARFHDIPIRIRSGGHNHEGFSTGTGVVVIDVSEMKKVHVDKDTNIATIQPGLNNKELYTYLFKEGLTHAGGTCSEVGLSGLILTGGMGPLLRRVGLTCDTLVSIDMVDASGNLIHATKDNENKDLFWASCGGGGGNFGVVTSMQITVYPAQSVTWFNIGWDWGQSVEEIISVWQGFFAKDNRRCFSHLDLWAKPFPAEKLRKLPFKVLGMYWGTPENARRELAPFLSIGKASEQIIKEVTWLEAIEEIEASTAVFLTSKPEYKSTGAFAKESLPPEAVRIIRETLENSKSALFNVLLFSMGGATQEIPPNATAYFYRDDLFFISYNLQWLKESEDKERIAEVDELRRKLLPYTEGDYVGNPDRSFKDYLKEYYGDNVRRLRCVKRKYDPGNVFKFEQSIPPAPADWKCD